MREKMNIRLILPVSKQIEPIREISFLTVKTSNPLNYRAIKTKHDKPLTKPVAS